jgi:hypothetical protein
MLNQFDVLAMMNQNNPYKKTNEGCNLDETVHHKLCMLLKTMGTLELKSNHASRGQSLSLQSKEEMVKKLNKIK